MVQVDSGRWTEANIQLEAAGVLEGLVLDARGEPIAGATLIASELGELMEPDRTPDPLAFAQRYGPSRSDSARATSGTGGAFRLRTHSRAGVGAYLVRAFTHHASGFAQGRGAAEGAQLLSVRLTPDALVTGLVSSIQGDLDRYSILGVEHRGPFMFARESLPEEFTIDAAHHRARPIALGSLPPGSVALGTIRLVGAHDVELEVTDFETGEPLRQIFAEIEGKTSLAAVNGEGHAVLASVPLPSARVWIGTEEHVPVRLEVGVAAKFRTTLSKGAALRFRVDPPSARLSGRITVACEAQSPMFAERTGLLVNGEATVSGLGAGRCSWRLWQGQYSGEVDVPSTGVTEVRIPIKEEPTQFLQFE